MQKVHRFENRNHCMACAADLTDEERQYYDGRCENCERKKHERIQRWRAGEEDEELDRLFSVPPRTVN